MANKTINKFEATMMAVQKAKMESRKKTPSKKAKRISESIDAKRKCKECGSQITEDEDDVADDVSDDVMVVVDPEMDVDDYQDRIDDLEDIVDNTPEDEVPLDDQYVGDEVYTCPVCGNAFFSDVDLHDGGTCPVCGEEVDDFVELGKVESTDEDGDGTVDPDEDLDPSNDDEFDDIDDDIDDEEDLDIDDTEVEEECNYSRYDLDESTLNPFLTKFIKENYKNAVSMKAVRASVNGKRLKIECAVKMKSGKNKMTTIVVENFQPVINRPFKMRGNIGKEFKTESKRNKPSLIIGAKLSGKTVKIESFKYNFVTVKEGKRYQIYGNYALKESKKGNFRRLK